MRLLNPILIGDFKKFRIIHPEKIAKCMQIVARSKTQEVFLDSDKILIIANSTVS